MTLPVVPKTPGIGIQRRNRDAGALEGAGRFAAIETGRVVDEAEHVVRQPEILHHRVADPAHRRQGHQPLHQARRDEAEQRGVDTHGHLRCVGGAAEGIEQVTNAHRGRVNEMEALAVLTLLVGDVIDRGDDEIDRDDIDAPALDADGRHPRRQHGAHLLDQLEEIIGAVDLVHLAGTRITDDEGRAVDAPRHAAFAADDAF